MSNANPQMKHIVLITLSAAIGGFLFGFDSSVINGANGALKVHFNATDYELAWSVSLALIGAAIGAFFAGRIADAFGRVFGSFQSAVQKKRNEAASDVSTRCPSCNASIKGRPGATVECPYCGSFTTLPQAYDDGPTQGKFSPFDLL